MELTGLLLGRGANKEHVISTDGRTILFDAIMKGSLQLTQLLLNHGARIDYQDSGGKTPLHMACNRPEFEFGKLLLDRGVNNIDQQDGLGRTPLFNAVANGNVGVVKLLLDRGANIYIRNSHGLTTLHHALGRRNIEFVYLLIQAAAQKQGGIELLIQLYCQGPTTT